MRSRFTNALRLAKLAEDRGAVLVVTVVAMTAVLFAAALAIDASLWYVHKRHLQTQADAAALAAAQSYQFNCGAAGDTAIKNLVHQYDGTGFTGSASPTVNGQVATQPTPSSSAGTTGHVEYSVVNQSNFQGSSGPQSVPGDTGLTGSPCNDGVIDVKMTEQGLKSFFVPFGPQYLNAQAQIGFQTAASTGGGEPFIEPLPTPSAVAVEFVNETTGAVLTTPGAVSLSTTTTGSTAGVTWTANGLALNVADPSASGSTTDEFPIGMRVAYNPTGGTASFPCTGSEVCYDNTTTTSNTGVVFARAWHNTGSPGLNSGGSGTTNPVAPQAGDVWLQPCTVSGSSCTNSCPSTPSPAASNFFASSTNTSEQLCANMTFTSTGGTSLTCAQSSLTVKAGSTAVTMNCPSAGPNGTWSSGLLTVPAYATTPSIINNGVLNVTMGWSVTNGCLPVGATGGTTDASNVCTQGATHKKCATGSACTGSFDNSTAAAPETVQQAYSGAYSLTSGLSATDGGSGPSNSGTIAAASVTNSSGNEIQSIQNGTNTTVNVSVSFYGFASASTVGTPPFELTLGGNQGNGNLGCNGNGVPAFQSAIENGCPGTYASTSIQPASSACPGGSTNATPGPATCVNTNPGNGKSKNISDALNTKIDGAQNAPCNSPNYWASGNSVGQILAQQLNGADDPRLVTLFYTDNVSLPGGSSNVPIRGFAEFYITGWGGGGDPCDSQPSGTNATTGLKFTSDDVPPDNKDGVIMGHFVTYINSFGTGSGSKCVQGALAICVPVLTK